MTRALLVYPEFRSASFWNYRETCELVDARYPAAPLGLVTIAAMLPPDARLAVAGCVLERATTFSDRPSGTAFWYENSNGLAEIAVNQGRADRDLGLAIGIPVEIIV